MDTALDVIGASIKDIIGTQIGERVMRPNYGCAIHDLPFEPGDNATKSLFRRHIIDAITLNEPRVVVGQNDVDCSFSTDSQENTSLIGSVRWKLRHSATGQTFTTDFTQPLGG